MNPTNPFSQEDFDTTGKIKTFAQQRNAKYPKVRNTVFNKTELESFRDNAQAPTPPIKPIVGIDAPEDEPSTTACN